MTERVNVAVLGGGPAGAATAIALANLGVPRILIAEAEHAPRFRVGETIPPDSRNLLKRFGILDHFLREGHSPCFGSCSSWGDNRLGHNDFMLSPYGHGWHLDRARFETFLLEEATARGVLLERGQRFQDATRTADGFDLTFSTGRKIRAGFVIDATGARAAFARLQGATRENCDTLQVRAALLEVSEPSLSGLTWLEATEYGWWYAARLPGDRCLFALSSDADILRSRQLTHHEGWMQALGQTRHIGRLQAFCQPVPLLSRSYAAPSWQLTPPVGPGWLAVGDAASSFDPITSQGLYKAMSTALGAADVAASFLAGNQAAVRHYVDELARDFQTYQDMRRHLYGMEQRWPDAAFWTRRHGRAEIPEGSTFLRGI